MAVSTPRRCLPSTGHIGDERSTAAAYGLQGLTEWTAHFDVAYRKRSVKPDIVRRMAKYSLTLDRTFHALSDPTRRSVIDALAKRGHSSVKELAEPFPIGLPTFLKHLKVLEDSGLITTTKTGRTRSCRLQRQPLGEAETWLTKRRKAVEDQLDAFATYVESIQGTLGDSR